MSEPEVSQRGSCEKILVILFKGVISSILPIIVWTILKFLYWIFVNPMVFVSVWALAVLVGRYAESMSGAQTLRPRQNFPNATALLADILNNNAAQIMGQPDPTREDLTSHGISTALDHSMRAGDMIHRDDINGNTAVQYTSKINMLQTVKK